MKKLVVRLAEPSEAEVLTRLATTAKLLVEMATPSYDQKLLIEAAQRPS